MYAIILAFLATLVVHCAVGPNWNNVRIISNECRSNWWINLLYLNNVVGVEAHGRVYDKVVTITNNYYHYNLSVTCVKKSVDIATWFGFDILFLVFFHIQIKRKQ